MAFNFKFLYKIYEKRLFKQIDSSRVPKHIAIIMDGNRRYARRQKNMKVTKGHELGADTLEKVRDWSLELGVDIVTVYAFSTDNFKRSKEEVDYLMNLFITGFNNDSDFFVDNNIELIRKLIIHKILFLMLNLLYYLHPPSSISSLIFNALFLKCDNSKS